MDTDQEVTTIELLDFSFEVPCDHQECDQAADYLVTLLCPKCSHVEKFFVCIPHWNKLSQEGLKAACFECKSYGTLSDFLLECRSIR